MRVRMKNWEKMGRYGLVIVLLVAATMMVTAISPAGAQQEELISLNVTQMDLQDLLRMVAEKANLNIIITKEVSGSVTVRLKDVDLWQALEAILESNGFTYRREKGIIRVVKLEKTAEAKEQLPTATDIVFLKHAKAEDMKKASQHLLSSSGTLEVDARSNALIITDTPENIDKIRELITRLDKPGVPTFNLKGILSAPDRDLAMINDRILAKGETIGDFTVTEIGNDTVTLRRGDQVITLKLREELRAVEK